MNHNVYDRLLRERFGDPIGSYAGDAPVGVRDEGDTCGGCSMPVANCTCQEAETCDACGMLPVGGDCGCGGGLREAVEPCSECGMMEVEGGCGCTHEVGVAEVAPPGKERMVKALKKDPDIDNPWAVAWSQHNKEKKRR